MTTPATSGNALPTAAPLAAPNPFQPSASDVSNINPPGSTNHGICSLTHQGRSFRFRTNPNSIWWTYDLITHVDETLGGRVVQLLGTRLGDLEVKVECGRGEWDYLMQTCLYLRNVISDQRGGNAATWEYTTRNWKLKVYAMNIPFQDQVQAVARELTLSFKIQEDVSNVISKSTLDAEFSRIQDGIYRVDQQIHNRFNDYNAKGVLGRVAGLGGALGGYGDIGPPNRVDLQPLGDDPGGINPLPNIPGIGGLTGLLGGI